MNNRPNHPPSFSLGLGVSRADSSSQNSRTTNHSAPIAISRRNDDEDSSDTDDEELIRRSPFGNNTSPGIAQSLPAQLHPRAPFLGGRRGPPMPPMVLLPETALDPDQQQQTYGSLRDHYDGGSFMMKSRIAGSYRPTRGSRPITSGTGSSMQPQSLPHFRGGLTPGEQMLRTRQQREAAVKDGTHQQQKQPSLLTSSLVVEDNGTGIQTGKSSLSAMMEGVHVSDTPSENINEAWSQTPGTSGLSSLGGGNRFTHDDDDNSDDNQGLMSMTGLEVLKAAKKESPSGAGGMLLSSSLVDTSGTFLGSELQCAEHQWQQRTVTEVVEDNASFIDDRPPSPHENPDIEEAFDFDLDE